MKSLVKLLTICLLVSVIAGCRAKPTEPPAGETEPSAPSWLEVNQLGEFFTLDQDWDAILAAAREEGVVVVYASSSRIEKQIDLWNAVYPDIVLEGYDVDGISTKMREEQNAGNVIGDVWFEGDTMTLMGEMYPAGMILPFIPSEFADALPYSEDQPFAIQRYGADVWMYNNEQNETCPITNWWQLVDGSYTNSIYYEDPLAEADAISLFVTLIKHGDDMAAAYQDYHGREWTTDEDYDDTTENAGWLWVKKFALAPNLVLMPGGDEIVEAMGTIGMIDAAGVANNSYSKVRDTLSGEAAVWACEGIEPTLGTSDYTVLGIANNAPHPNAAKLFVRFALTVEGRVPWNVLGNWPGRTDIAAPEGAPSFVEAGLWPDDGMLMYQIGSQVRDFWTLNALGGQ